MRGTVSVVDWLYNNCKVLGLTVDSEAMLTGYSKFLVIFTLHIF